VTDRDASRRADLDRRNVLTGIAAAGVAVPILAACGSSGAGGAAGSSRGIKTTDIPVGGGTVFEGAQIVITQPTAGEFKAFSAICTHQGCLVSKVASGKIDCPCHGSQYSIEDGSVEKGPATKGLAEKTVTVTGDSIDIT
jgi:nitrite reductase/ring-hydroxylating ferredoxin subunit